ncbi:MAG: hypothetical protein FWC50_04825, partial [Planctomycetaceae bacterium]|nr:hypothetical protein [Planctomycetaceae bacterium]
SRYGRQPSALRKRPALQDLPCPASGIFNRLGYILGYILRVLTIVGAAGSPESGSNFMIASITRKRRRKV